MQDCVLVVDSSFKHVSDFVVQYVIFYVWHVGFTLVYQHHVHIPIASRFPRAVNKARANDDKATTRGGERPTTNEWPKQSFGGRERGIRIPKRSRIRQGKYSTVPGRPRRDGKDERARVGVPTIEPVGINERSKKTHATN